MIAIDYIRYLLQIITSLMEKKVDVSKLICPLQNTGFKELYEFDVKGMNLYSKGCIEHLVCLYKPDRTYRVVKRIPVPKLNKAKFVEGMAKIVTVLIKYIT